MHALGQLRHQTVTNLTTTGRLLTARSSWEIAHGRDPLQSLEQAIQAFAQARVRRPNDLIAADEEGATWAARAEWQRENGQDPRPSIDRAIACSEDVLRIDPKDLDGHGNPGIELIERAEAERRYAGDPTPLLARARKSLDHALAIDPENVSVLQNLAGGERKARELADHGHDPTADLQAARRSLAHAQTIKRDDLTVLPVMCDLDRAAARWDLHLGRSPAAAFARARVSCEGALALDHDQLAARAPIRRAGRGRRRLETPRRPRPLRRSSARPATGARRASAPPRLERSSRAGGLRCSRRTDCAPKIRKNQKEGFRR